MQYVAESIAEMEGTYHLFAAKMLFAEGAERLVRDFRQLADARYEEICRRIEDVEATLGEAASLLALETAEEDLEPAFSCPAEST